MRNDVGDFRRRHLAEKQRIRTRRSRHSLLLHNERRALRVRRRRGYDCHLLSDWYLLDLNGYLEGHLYRIWRDGDKLLLLLLDRPDCRYGRVRGVGVAW